MMEWQISMLVAAGPAAYWSAGLIPSGVADRRPAWMRRGVAAAAAVALTSAIAAATATATVGPIDVQFLPADWAPLGVGVYFDALSAVMSLLVSFLGIVIVRYANRNLDGEPGQGRFLRWLSFTLGSVLTLTVAGNLLMFTAAWTATSFGLHQLLTFYRNRPAALQAARKKFLISRLGDAMLIAAMALTFQTFGSLEYRDLFSIAATLHDNPSEIPWSATLIGLLFVSGAMTKSAQFPMHTWLPDTMETPTPVSALMHAGVINAGGFLVIRLSPLATLSAAALDLLAAVGAFTALFAAVTAATQSSVKRSLAWSTVAQMGFMMLQCGLGAFSAALLHIVAHSLYKAHAFLSAGAVLEQSARTKIDEPGSLNIGRTAASLPAAAATAGAICVTTAWILGVTLDEKPGASALGFILAVALTQLLYQAYQTGRRNVALGGVVAAAAACASYYIAYLGFDHILQSTASHRAMGQSLFDAMLMGAVAMGFLAVFAMQMLQSRRPQAPLLKTLYVHASNGFYVDAPLYVLTTKIWGLR